jgi:hypothetical protein
MKRLIGIALALGVIASFGAPAGARSKAKPLQVFEDPSGDSGAAGENQPIPGTEQLGVDLTGGTIALVGKNLEFTVTHSAMPSPGSFPEGARFMWHFSVDKNLYRFTVKSADIGKPDVVAQTGTERIGQVDTDGVFRLETCTENPTPAITLIDCSTVADLEGSWDVANLSFTVVLPLKEVKGKPGSQVTGGTHWAGTSSCIICWVPHYAERSLTPYTILDYAVQTKTFVVPK